MQAFALRNQGQRLFIQAIFIFGAFLFLLRVKNREAREDHGRTLGAEHAIMGGDIDRGLSGNDRIHLGGDETVPDELIQLELVVRQVWTDILGAVRHR